MKKYNMVVDGHNWKFEIYEIINGYDGQATGDELCFSEIVLTNSSTPFNTEELVENYLIKEIKNGHYDYIHPSGKLGSICNRCKRQINQYLVQENKILHKGNNLWFPFYL